MSTSLPAQRPRRTFPEISAVSWEHPADRAALQALRSIPGVDEVRGDFDSIVDPIALALAQERTVTDQIKELFATARAENDFLGEQFMLWFLKEQVEEVAAMSTLLNVAQRAGNDWFDVETYLARESVGDAGLDAGAPAAAGGAL